MEVVAKTGAISRAKLQSNHHRQQTNIHFFTGRMPFLSPNQQCQSTEGKTHTDAYRVLIFSAFQLLSRVHLLLLSLSLSLSLSVSVTLSLAIFHVDCV